jgi:PAT family beta-lactamase induction signal transducer AmpG
MASGSKRDLLQKPQVWAFTTYFAEGFPYTLVRIVSSVFFRDMKVSLEAIGLTSLFGLPWILKFLWGPQIDQYATKRRWMLSMQLALVVVFFMVALLTPLPEGIRLIAILLFFAAFVAATHDMAIDGYYMEALDEKGQSKFVGYRVMAYRIAMMTGTGIVVSIGTLVSWRAAYVSAAGVLGLLYVYHLLLLPRVETYRTPFRQFLRGLLNVKLLGGCLVAGCFIAAIYSFGASDWYGQLKAKIPLLAHIRFPGWISLGLLAALVLIGLFKNKIKGFILKDREAFYSKAFIAYIDRDRIAIALAFIILMRTGESLLAAMASPFMVDLGVKVHYGWISGAVGLPFSIVGAMLGGWCISRYTLRKTIWPFLLAQNLTNLIYMFMALGLNRYVLLNTGADVLKPIGSANLFLVASVHAFDQFAGGLGTSVLITFLMRTCLPEFKAAHFAIGSGLMNVSGVFAGVMSGFLAQWLGYGYFFGLSFLASLPGMALIPRIPFVEPKKAS